MSIAEYQLVLLCVKSRLRILPDIEDGLQPSTRCYGQVLMGDENDDNGKNRCKFCSR